MTKPIDTDCPTCLSVAGMKCIDRRANQVVYLRQTPHPARIKAAKKKERKP